MEFPIPEKMAFILKQGKGYVSCGLILETILLMVFQLQFILDRKFRLL